MTASPRWRAIVLVDADRTTDAAASKRAGVNTTTLRAWRELLTSDPELAGHYARETQAAIGRYRGDISATLAVALTRMRELIPLAGVEDMSVLLQVSTQMGELLVQADALAPPKDRDETPADRKRQTHAADPDADPGDSRH